jgi:hypothetical protein
VKKNLKLLLPTLAAVFIVQFLLVRFYVGSANKEAAKVIGDIDTSIPHPSSSYDAKEVVQVVLYALRHNDQPQKDDGLRALWQFMTPRLKTQLRDKALVRPFLSEDIWLAIVDFDEYKIVREKINENEANFEVTFLSKKRLERRLIVSLQKKEDIWLVEMLAKKI